MKKITILAACVFAGSLAFALDKDKKENAESPKTLSGMGIIRCKASLFKLFYKSEEFADVTIEIFDSRNALVFKEMIGMSDGFMRPYNFARLPEGLYTIKLDNGSNWMVEKIEYRKGKIVNQTAQVISLKDRKYMLLMTGHDDEQFSVSVSGKEGDLIYREENAVTGSSAKLFNLKDAPVGPYKFEVSGPNGYTMTIIK